ncbi:MAG: MFS transporter [Candidatus Puniceispirillaceae bacterium]
MAENGHASSRAARLSWVLYDWASSPVPTLHATFVFSVYFTTVIAPENGSLYWAQMTALSAFLLAVAAPVMGRVADTKGLLKQGLIATTLAAALATAALWFIHPSPAFILPALLLSGLAIFLSEAAFLFYNGLLPSVADKQDYGRLSGLGWGTGYFGAIAALVLVLVLFILPDQPVTGTKSQLGGPVQLTMLFAGAWLVFFSLPLFIFAPRPPARPLSGSLWAQFLSSLKQAAAIPGMKRFLLARMAFTDGLVTLFAFGGIYAAKVFAFSQTEILIFAIALNITAGIGAVLAGPLTDRLGPSSVLRLSLMCLTGLGLVAVLAPDRQIFWATGLALGVFIGPCQSAARVWMARRVPPEHTTSLFGLFAFSGKVTSFVGPLCYGWLVLATGNERSGMAVVIVLLITGYLLLPPRQTQPG